LIGSKPFATSFFPRILFFCFFINRNTQIRPYPRHYGSPSYCGFLTPPHPLWTQCYDKKKDKRKAKSTPSPPSLAPKTVATLASAIFRVLSCRPLPALLWWWWPNGGGGPNGRVGAVARPPGGGGGGRRRSVEAKHPVVLFSGRVGRWYAHDPRVEERTHTSQTPDAEVGGVPGVPAHSLGICGRLVCRRCGFFFVTSFNCMRFFHEYEQLSLALKVLSCVTRVAAGEALRPTTGDGLGGETSWANPPAYSTLNVTEYKLN